MKLFVIICCFGASVIKADECVIEEDTKYDVDRGATNLNPDREGRTYFETYEECKTFCEEEYPDRAKFFTWNEGESGRQKNRLACRCKADATGKRKKKGMISGNLFCGTPAPPPPAPMYKKWRSDWKCGPNHPAPDGTTPSKCNPNGHAPCCSRWEWCGSTDQHCDWGNLGIDYRLDLPTEVFGGMEQLHALLNSVGQLPG